MVIGVISLQGDFAEHIDALLHSRLKAIEVRSKADLEACKAIVIPGGESTTIGKLLEMTGLNIEIKKRYEAGDLKIWGTCAGAILCATEIESDNTIRNLDLENFRIVRNAYGNQLDSFETVIKFNNEFDIECAFIRAPQIKELDESWKILSMYEKKPVFAMKRNILISTCHPELYENKKFYEWLEYWISDNK
jgi:pyridoxal 5'-phosphate synthase pdxT subunit